MLLLIKLKADENYNSPITLLYRLSYICVFWEGYKFDQQCQESNQTLGGIEPLPFIATGPAGSPWYRWLDSNQRPTAPKAKYLSYTMPLFIKLQADKNQDRKRIPSGSARRSGLAKKMATEVSVMCNAA